MQVHPRTVEHACTRTSLYDHNFCKLSNNQLLPYNTDTFVVNFVRNFGRLLELYGIWRVLLTRKLFSYARYSLGVEILVDWFSKLPSRKNKLAAKLSWAIYMLFLWSIYTCKQSHMHIYAYIYTYTTSLIIYCRYM